MDTFETMPGGSVRSLPGPFFISGYPRSGSTLLASILVQNPNVQASFSSPVAALLNPLVRLMGSKFEYSAQLSLDDRVEMLRGVFYGYYSRALKAGKIIIDTNRLWCARLDLLHTLFEAPKIIACVRDVAAIVESFERLTRSNPQLHSEIYEPEDAMNVYTRVEALMRPLGMIGLSESATLEAVFSRHSSSVMILDYDFLVSRPAEALESIYSFLGLGPYRHDFEHVGQIEHASYDGRLGIPDLHRVRALVRKVDHRQVLPPDIGRKLRSRNFWQKTADLRASEATFVPSIAA